jgi:hypothetical protein
MRHHFRRQTRVAHTNIKTGFSRDETSNREDDAKGENASLSPLAIELFLGSVFLVNGRCCPRCIWIPSAGAVWKQGKWWLAQGPAGDPAVASGNCSAIPVVR